MKTAGWRVVDNSPIEVVARIERGEKRKLHFRYLGASVLAPAETVTLRPYKSSVVIQQGSKVFWSRRSINMVPSLIRLKRGESLKKAVKRYEKSDPGYFKFVRFPARILKPEISQYVGRSTIRNGKWQDYVPR